MGVFEKIYSISPVFIQNTACSLYGYLEGKRRFGRYYWEVYNFLKSSDFWTKKQKSLYQKEKISALLLTLKKNEFYSARLNELSDDYIIESPFSALKKIDILAKKDVLENFNLIKEDVPGSYEVKTSGTTGSALRLSKSKKDMSAQTACWFRHRQRFGIQKNDLSVNFTGKMVVPSRQVKPPFHRYNLAWNQYLVNMRHINEKNIKDIFYFLNGISPKFYSGYPSIIADVARLSMESNLFLSESSRPSVVFCGAENVLEWQRDLIHKWTGALVTDLYGLTEGACNLSRCHHGYFHEDFEVCYTEVIDSEELSGRRLRGRLVGTGFELEAFPLVRYDTGDIAVQMPRDFACACGRDGNVYESIEGRVDDYIVTPSGSRVMRFDYLFKDTFEIKEAQVVQKKIGEVLFKLNVREVCDKKSVEEKLTHRFNNMISRDMILHFEYVDSIEKGQSGKFKAVINMMSE